MRVTYAGPFRRGVRLPGIGVVLPGETVEVDDATGRNLARQPDWVAPDGVLEQTDEDAAAEGDAPAGCGC